MRGLRKLVCVALVGASLACMQLTALAGTVTFNNFKVGIGLPDPETTRTSKAGGSSFENKYYVTITAMSPSNSTVVVKSLMNSPAPLNSDEVYVTNGSKTSGNYNNGTAPAGELYYMKSRFYNSPQPTITFSGRFTP